MIIKHWPKATVSERAKEECYLINKIGWVLEETQITDGVAIAANSIITNLPANLSYIIIPWPFPSAGCTICRSKRKRCSVASFGDSINAPCLLGMGGLRAPVYPPTPNIIRNNPVRQRTSRLFAARAITDMSYYPWIADMVYALYAVSGYRVGTDASNERINKNSSHRSFSLIRAAHAIGSILLRRSRQDEWNESNILHTLIAR